MCLQTRDFRGKQTRCPTPCLERERPRQSSPVDQALTEVHQAGAEEGASTSADCRCERIGKEVGEYTVPAIECALSEPLEPAYDAHPCNHESSEYGHAPEQSTSVEKTAAEQSHGRRH